MILYNYIETTNEGTDAVFVLLRRGKFIPYAYLQVDPLYFTVSLSLTYDWKLSHCLCKPHCPYPGLSGQLRVYVNVLFQWLMNSQASKPWLKCKRFGLSNINKYVSFIFKPSFAEYLLFMENEFLFCLNSVWSDRQCKDINSNERKENVGWFHCLQNDALKDGSNITISVSINPWSLFIYKPLNIK